MIEVGIKGKHSVVADETNSAKALGSGSLDVFGTPSMVALMEATSIKSLEDHLEPGQTTVGTGLDIKHTAATPFGMTVTCESELIEVDRRRLVFQLSVYDERGPIGEGTHERFIVDEKSFQEKTDQK